MSHQENGGRRYKRWSERSRGARIGLMAAAFVVLAPALLALFGAGTMWLWNWLMPAIFKLPTIGFWQAVGLLLLSHILFKGGYARRAGRSSWQRSRIREQMREAGGDPKAE
ncbi:MAG TPA: hypothetical protein VMI93_06225 [Candidatus Solibacter sp.]|nr:hypothetical protein [Candidatus Solibacter sp.]